jgi:hypothetical protein
MDIGGFGNSEPPTRTRIGRLKYATKKKAQQKADALGLSGTHSHKMKGMNGGERFYMPGTTHKKLNKALKKRGMRPTKARENGMGGMGGGGMGGGSMMGGGSGDRDRDRPSAFDRLRDDDDRDRKSSGLGDLAVGAVGLGLGLGALGELSDDGDGGDTGGDGGGGLYE